MNEGVKILLERIKTNPEEFTTQEKWGHLIQSHKMFLNEEDAKALDNALNELMQQRFTEKIMKELLAPEEDDSLGKPWYSKQSAMPLGGAIQGTYTATPCSNTVTLETSEHMKAHIEVLEMAKKAEVKKEHQTLFGKLFNYS